MYPAEYADEAGVSFYNVKGRKDAEYERSCSLFLLSVNIRLCNKMVTVNRSIYDTEAGRTYCRI